MVSTLRAMETEEEEDVVALVLTPSDAPDWDQDYGDTHISSSEIGKWDLTRIIRSHSVRLPVSRRRLVERSSYFRGLLGGSFRCANYANSRWKSYSRLYFSMLIAVVKPANRRPRTFASDATSDQCLV